MPDLYFHSSPLSYAPVIGDFLGKYFSETSIAPIAPILIYEDTPECVRLIKELGERSLSVYLLDFTALSVTDGASSILSFLPATCKIFVPWSHRVSELKSMYPKHDISFLALPLIDQAESFSASEDISIAFSGALESRLSETYNELSEIFGSDQVRIVNLNSNEELLRNAITEEGLVEARVVYPKSAKELVENITSSKIVVYCHNTNIREIHWSYLYSLQYRIPALLGLRSDLEGIPQVADRYYLGLESIKDKISKLGTDKGKTTKLVSYVQEIHSLDVFIYELKKWLAI